MASTIRVAAAGDIHAGTGDGDRVREAFARIEDQADLVLLAGDLTRHGQVDEICVVADACRGLAVPVVAVLGNHDWHSDRPADLVRALGEAGVVVLERTHTILPIAGASVGIVGVKGFVGGFGSQWANFGEPLFREAYAETTRDVEGLETGLRAIDGAGSGSRSSTTRRAPTRWSASPSACGSSSARIGLRGPIREHRPHLVLHGHAHHGSFEGSVDGVPVYNVAVHVMGREFWVFDLAPEAARQPIAVEEA